MSVHLLQKQHFKYPVIRILHYVFLNWKELHDPGIDWESAVLQEDSNDTVVVVVECPLDEETLEGLQRTINPLEHSQSHGYDLYIVLTHAVKPTMTFQ